MKRENSPDNMAQVPSGDEEISAGASVNPASEIAAGGSINLDAASSSKNEVQDSEGDVFKIKSGSDAGALLNMTFYGNSSMSIIHVLPDNVSKETKNEVQNNVVLGNLLGNRADSVLNNEDPLPRVPIQSVEELKTTMIEIGENFTAFVPVHVSAKIRQAIAVSARFNGVPFEEEG